MWKWSTLLMIDNFDVFQAITSKYTCFESCGNYQSCHIKVTIAHQFLFYCHIELSVNFTLNLWNFEKSSTLLMCFSYSSMKKSINHKYYMPVTENFLSFRLQIKCKKILWVEVKMTEFEYKHYFATLQKALYWNTLNLLHKHVWFVSIGELYIWRLEICPGISSQAIVELFDVCEKSYVNDLCNNIISFTDFLVW